MMRKVESCRWSYADKSEERMRAKLPIDSLPAECVLYSCMWVTGSEIPNKKERTRMPRPALYTLSWCEDSQRYELQSGGKTDQWFRQGDEQAFARWLAEHTAFSFAGWAGRLSVRKEGRG